MENSGMKKKIYVGGQAVIEGVMMRGPRYIVTAVRNPQNEIVVQKDAVRSLSDVHPWLRKPVVRGMISLYESLVYGMKSLMFSAQASGTEEEKPEHAEMGATLLLSVLIAVGVFFVLPTFAVRYIPGAEGNPFLLNIYEGLMRLLLFLGYLAAISLMPDIRRVFEYHGAEHKTIFCYEKGLPLTVENVRIQSRLHPRCGTNFLMIVMVVSIVCFAFLGWPGLLERIASRIVLLPLIAGISYEWLRFAAVSQNRIVRAVNHLGIYLELFTTREPHDDQMEVAIRSLSEAAEQEETGTC